MGRTYEKQNKLKPAEEAYEKAMEINPASVSVREGLGRVCFQLKKVQKAEAHLKEARRLRSRDPEVYFLLGEIERMEGFCRTAITAYRQALALDPNYQPARNGLKAAEQDCRSRGPRTPQTKTTPSTQTPRKSTPTQPTTKTTP